jgi:hypothetical protein
MQVPTLPNCGLCSPMIYRFKRLHFRGYYANSWKISCHRYAPDAIGGNQSERPVSSL